MHFYPTSAEANTYSEHLLRWLAARRDFPDMDVGPEPACIDEKLREDVMREFYRSA